MRRCFPLLVLTLLGSALLGRPQSPATDLRSPDEYQVRFKSSGGDFVIAVHRAWAPRAADRFFTLAQAHYYDGDAVFRVIPKFAAQWGLNPDPAVIAPWLKASPPDDSRLKQNLLGYVSFARDGAHASTTEVFVNLAVNTRLDGAGFTPFGEIVKGYEVVLHFYPDYGDGPPNGDGPDQTQIVRQGAAYLNRHFGKLDHILSATVQEP